MECTNIVNEYIKWIKDNTIVKTIDNGNTCSISTPFLDRHNDHLEIYVQNLNGKFILTDDSYTLSDLAMSGFEINTPKRENILKTLLLGFGVKSRHNELFVEADVNTVGQKKHALIQSMLAVNDMFNLAQETVLSLFKEDVEYYFRKNNIIFTKDLKIGGKSGFDHNVDFIIPESKLKPERLIKTVNNPKKDTILSAIMAFNDIREIRSNTTNNYVLYNDLDKKVSNEIFGALDSYNVSYIPWSEKASCIREFSLN